MNKVCIIIPAFNEAETIGAVIDEAPLIELKQAGFDSFINMCGRKDFLVKQRILCK